MFGERVAAVLDLYVVRNVSADRKIPQKLVLIFEDKAEWNVGDGHLGQIVAECIMLHFHNYLHFSEPLSSVFCIRIINHYVQFSSLICDRLAIEKICLTPPEADFSAKMTLLHHHPDPTSFGLDLLDQGERAVAVDLMSRIRDDVLR